MTGTSNPESRQRPPTWRRLTGYAVDTLLWSGVVGFLFAIVSGFVPALADAVTLSGLVVALGVSLAAGLWLWLLPERSRPGGQAAWIATNHQDRRVLAVLVVALTLALVAVIEFLWGWTTWVTDTELPFLWLALALFGGTLRLLLRHGPSVVSRLQNAALR